MVRWNGAWRFGGLFAIGLSGVMVIVIGTGRTPYVCMLHVHSR